MNPPSHTGFFAIHSCNNLITDKLALSVPELPGANFPCVSLQVHGFHIATHKRASTYAAEYGQLQGGEMDGIEQQATRKVQVRDWKVHPLWLNFCS